MITEKNTVNGDGIIWDAKFMFDDNKIVFGGCSYKINLYDLNK